MAGPPPANALPDELPPPVQAWLDNLAAWDLDGLVETYGNDALLHGLDGLLMGRAEIRDRLQIHWRRLRNLRVEGTACLDRDGDQVTFETTLQTLLGRARLRHEMRVRGGHIHEHAMSVVEFHKAFPWSANLKPSPGIAVA